MSALTERELDAIIAAARQAKRDAAHREFARDIIQQIIAQAKSRKDAP